MASSAAGSAASSQALTGWPHGNGLLDRVPAEERYLLKLCERVDLDDNSVIYEPGAPLTHVYFMLSGMVSLVAIMADGRPVETMTIGREGAFGMSASGYVDPAFTQVIVQVPGQAIRVKAADFEDMIDASSRLCSTVARYREVLLRTTLQIVACNAVHSVRQRCARWIMTTHDRSAIDLLPLTQATLAEMLGVKRNAVSGVARELRRLGIIEFTRGNVTVVDRGALAGVSCECYSVVAGELGRISTDPLSPECID